MARIIAGRRGAQKLRSRLKITGRCTRRAFCGNVTAGLNTEGKLMRFGGIVSVVAVLACSAAAWAQAWNVYTNRDNFFTVNLPGEPKMTEVPYKTLKGTNLTARVFTATTPATSILAGTYKVTVVDYTNAKDEIMTADDQAVDAIKAKGTVKYEGINNLDLHLSHRLTVETATTRILAEILVAQNNRLYITEAATPLNV